MMAPRFLPPWAACLAAGRVMQHHSAQVWQMESEFLSSAVM